ncbi:hypothetical protein [Streptomyces sp. NPDC056160]
MPPTRPTGQDALAAIASEVGQRAWRLAVETLTNGAYGVRR